MMSTKMWHSVVIGLAIVIGCVLHAAVSKIPEALKIQRGYAMQVRMMEMTPKEIVIGDTSLLYLPKISYRGLSIDVDYKFYRYEANSLVQISLKSHLPKN